MLGVLRGGTGKWKYIKETIMKEDLDMVCVQETKTDSDDPNMCRGLWDTNMARLGKKN